MAVIAYQYRGDLVDQIHRGHIAVTDHTGKILWKLGDPERLTFARSSAKPLQAIPVAESGALEHYGITPQELAVICSSHNGEPFHVKAVESILHKAGLSPDQLCCGSEYPNPPSENKLMTQAVRIGLNGKKHRRNLNTLVCGGSGAGKTRFYCKPNLMQANTSFVILDPNGYTIRG